MRVGIASSMHTAVLILALIAPQAHSASFGFWISSGAARFGAPLADGGRILEASVRSSFNGSFAERGYRFSSTDSLIEQLAASEHGVAVWDGGMGMLVMDRVTSTPATFFARANRGVGSALPAFTIAALDSSADAQPGLWSVAPTPEGGAWFVGTSVVGTSGARTRLWKTAADGTPASGWASSGRNLWTADASAGAIVHSDGSGAAVVFGTRSRFNPTLISWLETSRVLPDGTSDPAWDHAPLNQLGGKPASVMPLSDGYLLVYSANEAPGVDFWRALRISATGTLAAGWPDSGVVVGRVGARNEPFSDGADGLYFVDWSASPSLHHVLGDGSRPLGENGAMIAPSGSEPVAEVDGSGGLLVVWTEDPAGLARVRVRGVGPSGATLPTWPDTGVAVTGSLSSTRQRGLAVTSDGSGGALVAWQHYDGFTYNLGELTRTSAPGVLATPPPTRPSTLSLSTLGAHPARGVLRLALETSSPAEAELSLHDLAGRTLRRERVEGGTRRQVDWSLVGIPPGVVLVRVAQAGASVTRRVVVLR